MTTHVIVNCWFLTYLSGFGVVSDEERSKLLRSVDPNDCHAVKKAICTYIKPRLDAMTLWSPETWKKIKTSLSYFLTKGNFGEMDIEEVYEASEPAFDLPSNPIDYYHWAWEVLFPNEDYLISELTHYVVHNTR